jgi:vacuolar protein-sorting-associated protein 4
MVKHFTLWTTRSWQNDAGSKRLSSFKVYLLLGRVSLADITSKFIGESEKLLNILFELAREEAPSIILIDEMDSLGRTRTGNESETERRIKTEFLKQMDKIRTIPEKVSVFATTNMPWELDIAALRRFERKILVPMPDFKARAKILELHSGIQHRLTQ